MVSLLWTEDRKLLNREIDSFLPQGPFFKLLRYHLEGGKMLRPLLCLSASRALGGERDKALPVACALELVHNFTLIHDDIEDGSELRRGKPALWKVCGQAQAINAADALFALAQLCLLKAAEKGVDYEKVYQLEKLFNSTCVKICQAQHLDLCWEKEAVVTQEEYFSLAVGKTGALFECSLISGALVADADEKTLDSLRRCGHFLGIGFQIQDDVFGLQDKEKAVPEIKRKKKTFPIIYALEKDSEMLKLYQKESLSLDDISQILILLKNMGALEHSLKVAQEFYHQALEALKQARFPHPAELEELILFLERRSG